MGGFPAGRAVRLGLQRAEGLISGSIRHATARTRVVCHPSSRCSSSQKKYEVKGLATFWFRALE